MRTLTHNLRVTAVPCRAYNAQFGGDGAPSFLKLVERASHDRSRKLAISALPAQRRAASRAVALNENTLRIRLLRQSKDYCRRVRGAQCGFELAQFTMQLLPNLPLLAPSSHCSPTSTMPLPQQASILQ
jgi:hypothetical protein